MKIKNSFIISKSRIVIETLPSMELEIENLEGAIVPKKFIEKLKLLYLVAVYIFSSLPDKRTKFKISSKLPDNPDEIIYSYNADKPNSWNATFDDCTTTIK